MAARILFVYCKLSFTIELARLSSIGHGSSSSGRPSSRPTQRQPHSISFNAMSVNPSPELKSLFEAALNEFEKRAGSNLVRHQIIDKLVNCESADSVIDVLQEQAQAFRNFRGDDGKLMMWLKRTVNVLYTLSTSDVVCGGISLVCVYSFLWHVPCNISLLQPFPPAKAIFAGIAILLGVSTLHEVT
jgi:hypothetical protein